MVISDILFIMLLILAMIGAAFGGLVLMLIVSDYIDNLHRKKMRDSKWVKEYLDRVLNKIEMRLKKKGFTIEEWYIDTERRILYIESSVDKGKITYFINPSVVVNLSKNKERLLNTYGVVEVVTDYGFTVVIKKEMLE